MPDKTAHSQTFTEGQIVGVVVCAPLDKILDYKTPACGVQTGSIVQVNLARRKVLGIVWGAGKSNLSPDKIRPIAEVLDLPPLDATFRDFLTRVGDYTLSSLNAMAGLAVRTNDLMKAPPRTAFYRFGRLANEKIRTTPPREALLNFLKQNKEKMFSMKDLQREANVNPSVVKGLLASGLVQEIIADSQPPIATLDHTKTGLKLTDLQTTAALELREQVARKTYHCTLLKGVTGSGKTEVYMEAVAECLKQGRQALILLPEIALSVSFVQRFQDRFGATPAQWHSGVSPPLRRQCWRGVADGQVGVVIGARSALFLPFKNLGLIVVDEEHDSSYKQEETVFYSARDMSVMRGLLSEATVILSSATPSLETWVNSQQGKYGRIDLPYRYGHASYPDIEMIDLRAERGTGAKAPKRWISPLLETQVHLRLERGEQSLLFLNRRGYAPITVCQECGQQVACHQCDFRLVEHKFHNRLMCHHCGETRPVPGQCPSCDAEAMATIGPGVERVYEEARRMFPTARIDLLSSDMALSARALKDKIESIAAGEADIIIGTQLVAKGHHFPHLTCVGVIDADLGLFGSDLRAAERSFQLIRQVAGRAGRADKAGVAYLQTYQPDHPVMQAIKSGEEEAFWAAEAEQREVFAAPPYARWVGVIINGRDAGEVRGFGRALVRCADALRAVGAEVYGPAEAPVSLVRGRYRMRLLVKADKQVRLGGALRAWRAVAWADKPKDVRFYIDVDPQSFY